MQTNSVLCQVESIFLYTIKVKFQTQDRAMFQADSGSPGARSSGPHAVCVFVTNNVVLAQSVLNTAVSVTPAMLHIHAPQKILLKQPIGTVLFRQSGSNLR